MTDRSTKHWVGRHYDADHIRGPIGFLNPTTRFHPIHRPTNPSKAHSPPTQAEVAAAPELEKEAEDEDERRQKQQHSHTGIYAVWRSRDNRKGRHALALTPSAAEARTGGGAVATLPKRTDSWDATMAGIGRMLMKFPIWDVSYDVAIIFTLGSVVWVMNGFFVLLPLTNPGDTFNGESAWGGGVTAVVGATIFELGSVLLMIEAVNENRSECFGWALEEALDHSEDNLLLLKRDKSTCRHHHAEKSAWLTSKGSVGSEEPVKGESDGEKRGDDLSASAATDSDQSRRTWTWCPSWYELRTHYFRDIGFLACLSQMFGATIFWISGFTGLPQILNVLPIPAEHGIYWLPQVVGGTGFIVSSWLFMLETQSKWWIPAPTVLGWHIGFWNLIGALGFTLCGAFGFGSSNEACEIALTWSTFIGSWAFLIGSVLQWYESVDKYPVAINKTVHVPQTRRSEELA